VPAEPCCAPSGPRTWGSADYLLWWVRKAEVPPLVVTGSPLDAFPGALGQPNTQVLFGNHERNYDTFSGLRLNLGAWLDGDRLWGVEAGGFALERRSVGFSACGRRRMADPRRRIVTNPMCIRARSRQPVS
jgi:hypothetical protein